MFTSEYKIKFDDIDAAGIVYYPRYFNFCHEVFEEFFNKNYLISYPELILNKFIGFPVVSIKSNFVQPIFYGDKIKIIFEILKIKNSSVITNFKFLKQDILVFSAEIIVVCINLKTKKSQKITDNLREFLNKFLVL